MSKETQPDIRRTLIFLRRGDQVLLALKKRGLGAGKWLGAGGKLEPGETVEEALVRETIEEIGVTPTSWQPAAELDFIQDAETDDPWHMYIHAYVCTEWRGEPTESEEMMPHWFRIKDIPYSEMWDDDEIWFPYMLDDKKVFGTFTFDKNNRLLTSTIQIVDTLPNEKKYYA